MTLELGLILAYLLVQLGIGVWISRRIHTESDYLVAGRRLGYVLATFSIFATWFGAETVVGAAGNAYRDGVSLAAAEPFGYGLCLVLMGVVFAVPLWRRGLTTLADLFRTRYSVATERVAAVILIPSSVLWAAAQVRAFGHVISTASAWDVQLAIGIAAGFTILYTMFGGLLVDAVTDVIQGVVVASGLILLLALLFVQLGGAGGVQGVIARSAGVRLMPAGGAHPLDLLEEWAIPVFGSVLATELVGRVIATRNAAVARRTPLAAAALYIGIGIIPVALGLAAAGLGLRLADPEQAVPTIARELMPPFVYAAFVGAFISAILSTVDSTLLTASGLLSHNLLIPLARISDERYKVLAARAGVLLFGILAYALALTADGVYDLVESASAMGSAGAFVTICFALFTGFGGPIAATSTLLVGTLVYGAGEPLGLRHPFLTALAASLASYLAIALWETTRSTPHLPTRS